MTAASRPEGAGAPTGSASPRGARRRRGERTRKAILDAAGELFARHGYDATSLTMIAEAAAITTPGLLHHFPSKAALVADLLVEVDEAGSRWSRDDEDTPVDAGADDTPREALRRIADVTVAELADPDRLRVLGALSGAALAGDRVLHELMVTRHRRRRSQLAGLVQTWLDSGAARAHTDPQAVAAEIQAITRGALSQWLQDPSRVDVSLLVRASLGRLADGVLSTPSAG